jgi:hypothetical protein
MIGSLVGFGFWSVVFLTFLAWVLAGYHIVLSIFHLVRLRTRIKHKYGGDIFLMGVSWSRFSFSLFFEGFFALLSERRLESFIEYNEDAIVGFLPQYGLYAGLDDSLSRVYGGLFAKNLSSSVRAFLVYVSLTVVLL